MKIYSILSLSALLILSTLLSPSWAGDSHKNISVKEVNEMISSQGENLLLLDVRSHREYRAGHLENSKLIPINELSNRLDEIEAYRDKDIVVYCAIGGRSSKGAALLKRRGFDKVYNMSGGIKAWKRHGHKIKH